MSTGGTSNRNSPRGRPSATTHDEIRAAANVLFREHGYAQTSLTMVAGAAGISRTTLFSYFPAKRDLLWEEFDQSLQRLEEVLRRPSTNGTLLDVLVDAIEHAHRFGIADHDELSERWRIVDADHTLRATTTERLQKMTDLLIRYAQEWTADTDRHASIEVSVVGIFAAATHLARQWASQAHVSEAMDIYVRRRLNPLIHALRPLFD